MLKSKSVPPAWDSAEFAELQVTIDRLRGRSIHCNSLAQMAHSMEISTEFGKLAQDYEIDAMHVETQLRRMRVSAF